LQAVTDAPYREAECRPAKIAKLLSRTKDEKDARAICMVASAKAYNRNNKRHELKRPPDDVTHDILVGCFMLADGVNEKLATTLAEWAMRP
jgi:hypothetical protein